MISLLHDHIHDLRYQVRYAKISYRQKYYSTSRNPRVIQAKIGNEPLISLRTYPQDEYLARPDEFLVLERRRIEAADEIVSNEIISNDLMPPFEDPFMDFSRLSSFQEGEEVEEITSTVSIELGDIEPIELPKLLKLKERFRFFRERYQNMNVVHISLQPSVSIPSPIMELLDEETSEDEINVPLKEETTVVSTPRRLSLHQPKDLPTGVTGSKTEVWKSVLNDISLVAAKVSIGHSPKSSKQFRVLSGDFINAEIYQENNEPRHTKRTSSDGILYKLNRNSSIKRPQSTSYYDIISLYND